MITDITTPVQGLNGNRPTRFGRFFRKLVKTALDIVENIPVVGDTIVEILNDNTNIDGWIDQAYKTATAIEYEPTPAEEAVLDAWATNVFNPFLKSLASDLSAAFQNTSVTVQLAGINRALARMCVVTTYYASNDTKGLSANAVKFRIDLVAELLDPILDMIDEAIVNTNLDIVVAETATTINPADFPKMNIQGRSFQCLQYRIASGTTAQEIQTAVIPKPNTTIPVKEPVVVDPAVPVSPTAPATITPTPRRRRLFFGIAAGCLILYALSGDDDNKKNSN